jgi:hypothetical protein
MINPKEPSLEKLHEMFYVTSDGRLMRKISTSSRARAGQEAGNTKGCYREVRIETTQIRTHRVIFAMVNGWWPNEVDHINMNGRDNRPENLRAATHNQNMCNCGPRKRNKSGIKGVSWSKETKKWYASICYQQRTYSLGHYEDIEKARTAYNEAAKRLHGEFMRAA